MWASSVWGLIGLSLSCGLTMLGLSPDSPWQPRLILGAALFCVGSLVVLFWPLRDKTNRAKFATFMIHPKEALRLIEPIHVIVLGLAIALGGAVWQWQLTRSKNKLLAHDAISVASASHQIPLKRKMTAYDVGQRQIAIDGFLKLIDQLDGVLKTGQTLEQNLLTKITSGTVIPELDKFSENYTQVITEYFDRCDEMQKFPDIQKDAVTADWQVRSPAYLASKLKEQIQSAGQLNPDSPYLRHMFGATYNRPTSDWSMALTQAKNWINEKRNALIKRREDYEKVEVYPANKSEK
jgi:hypothetical protein